MKKPSLLLAACSLAAISAVSFPAFSQTDPLESVFQNANAPKADNGVRVSVDGIARATFESGNYPGFELLAPAGAWNLSAFAGVEAQIKNVGTSPVTVALRVDNEGDWKAEPFNTESVKIAPAQTQTVRVTFGRSYGGNAGFALDSSKVSRFKIFAVKPPANAQIEVLGLKCFGTGGTPIVAAPVANSAKPTIKTLGELIDPKQIDAFKGEKAAVSRVDEGIKWSFEPNTNYPTLVLPAAIRDLTGAGGLEARVKNNGSESLRVGLRVDSGGKDNSEILRIGAGETKTIKVTFGRSYGSPGAALDVSQIDAIRLFPEKPKQAGSLTVSSVKPTLGALQIASSTNAPAGPANYSPPITGELLVVNDKFDASTLVASGATVRQIADGIEVTFEAGQMYPRVEFPVPPGGLNLVAHGGVQLEVTNIGTVPVNANLRVDNVGDWKLEPWNTEKAKIEPGKTVVLNLVFGQNNGAPAYPLDSTRVSGMQFFAIKPQAGARVLLRDLRAVGSPAPQKSAFSSPEDRNLPPLAPPSWVGQRPPVEGNWVSTLNESFDAPQVNRQLWGIRSREGWNDLIPGQLQRYSWDNLEVRDGVLRMKIEKRAGHQYDDPKEPVMPYTSAIINTYDRWTQAYGYFEARIKQPTAHGLWPAFWMMPDRGRGNWKHTWERTDTKNGAMEIDVMEHLTKWGPGRYNVGQHWDGYGKDHKSWTSSFNFHRPTPDGFHAYGVLWEPGKLTYFVDGKKMAVYENERVASVPNYLILNVQMGGWGGNDIEDAKLPQWMEVDYVRAWQLKERVK